MNKICRKPGRKKTHLVKGLKGAGLAAEHKDNEKNTFKLFFENKKSNICFKQRQRLTATNRFLNRR